MQFKRVKLMGKNLAEVRPKILERNMEIVEDNFDLVIAHGGDGTLLWAERDYPGIPKLPLRDAATAPQCHDHGYDQVLDRLIAGELEMSVLPKLEGIYNGKHSGRIIQIKGYKKEDSLYFSYLGSYTYWCLSSNSWNQPKRST